LTIGWTGRAMRAVMEPRYDSHTDESGFFACVNGQSSVLIFEGPLDAIRAASLSGQFGVIATTGKRMTPAFLYYVRQKQFSSIYIVPDNDVPPHEYQFFLRYLSSFCGSSNVQLLTVPSQAKDLCDLTEEENLQWLAQIGNQSLNRGQDRGRNGRPGTVNKTSGV
jgi:Toprim-like